MRQSTATLLLVTHLILRAALGGGSFADEDNPLYDASVIPTIRILIDADSLAAILDPANAQSDYEFPATFVFQTSVLNDTVRDIGFRLRGNTSRYAQKKSFKISFNTFISGRKYYGVEKLNINGEHNDPSIIRSKLCWDLFKTMRVPGPRANHVMLYINDEYYGLYINVEHIDENFVKSRFDNNDGNLYKCLWPADLVFLGSDPDLYKYENEGRRAYELKTNENLDDYSDLADFIANVNLTPDPFFPSVIEQEFNVNAFLKYLALNVAVGSWDDYWFLKNNYYLYHNTETSKWEWIPYDYDNTFGIWWDGIYPGIDWATRDIYGWGHPDEMRPLVSRILAVPAFRDRFSFYLNRLLHTAFEPATLFPRVDDLHDFITQAAEADQMRTLDYGFNIADFHNSYNQALGQHVTYGLKNFVSVRQTSAQSQLVLNDIAPLISEVNFSPKYPAAGDRVLVTAFLEDETTAIAAEINFTLNGSAQMPVAMLDDGQNNDGLAGDGTYGGLLPPVPAGASIEFYLSAGDGNGNQSFDPVNAPEQKYRITSAATAPRLFLNEFMASNDNTVVDDFGEFEDWVEIYNGDTVTVSLAGMFLTDNLANPDKWGLPDTTMQPGEFLLIWTDDDGTQGPTHTSYNLSKDGEQLGIFMPNAGGFVALDTLTFGPQQTDISYGRAVDGGLPWQTFTNPTPGTSNSSATHIVGSTQTGPDQFLLHQNYPNPFNGATTITFNLPVSAEVSVEIFNIRGKQVRLLSRDRFETGTHKLKWDGRNDAGHIVATGIYVIRVQTAFQNQTLIPQIRATFLK